MQLPISSAEFASRLLSWYGKNRRPLPWRRSRDPYRVWLSEVMLQQTQVKTVIPYFEKFVRAYPTLQALARAEENEVLSLWSGLGYYSRARNLQQAAQLVCENHGGKFPQQYAEALRLPGVGPYTAGAVLSIAYGQALPVLDGNVRRVLARYLKISGDIRGAAATRLWTFLSRLVQEAPLRQNISDFNQALMELGSEVCTPRAPRCPSCPLQDSCQARLEGLQEQLPVARKRQQVQEVNYLVALVSRRDKWLLRRNLDGEWLKGLWEFPRVEGLPGEGVTARFAGSLGLHLRLKRIAPPIGHRITFRKLNFFPVLASLQGPLPPGRFTWGRPGTEKFPVSSYVRKVLDSLK